MKNLLLAALAIATLSSCLSSKVRDEALVPAASLAWPGVRADVERGIEDAMEDGDLASSEALNGYILELDAVLQDGADRDALHNIPWGSLEPYGYRGIQDRIDDNEMHALVAESLFERMRNFTSVFNQLLLARVPMMASPVREHWLANGGGRVTSETAVAVSTL